MIDSAAGSSVASTPQHTGGGGSVAGGGIPQAVLQSASSPIGSASSILQVRSQLAILKVALKFIEIKRGPNKRPG